MLHPAVWLAAGLGLIAAALPQLPAAEAANDARATETKSAAAIMHLDIGLTARHTLIEGVSVPGRAGSTAVVLLIGGLAGRDASVATVRAAVASYEREPRRRRGFRLLAIALANPDGTALQFPPKGTAYRDQRESHVLWRWIGVHAPDQVLVAGPDAAGLATALSTQSVAEVGRIPARALDSGDLGKIAAEPIEPSEAHREIARRLARTPLELAEELARYYGHDLNQVWYIQAIALTAQLRLGHLKEVEQLAEPYVNGTRDSLAHPNSLVFAGHLLFGELARRTGDPRYLARVRAAANYGFETDGRMKEAMPFHNGFSDSLFMGTDILAQAGALTGERRYFDMAARHIEFMRRLDLRPDGLYRHHPGTEVDWGRGNAFAAIGLAIALSDFPPRHPAFARIRDEYRAHMAALLAQQDGDGMWRNVVDLRGSYSELSATAMIAFAIQRGIERGWLPERRYGPAVERAWQGVLARVGPEGSFVDVCESTARAQTLEDYMTRTAILGPDPRGGAMVLLLATELAGLK
ncbi:MAG TPA: glycoside hydrolase family 88 protein [Steroidobacteraceae bacterium]|nr:glycoside hydrolase family 88 protein [Steroidobacteraceae bacterium]